MKRRGKGKNTCLINFRKLGKQVLRYTPIAFVRTLFAANDANPWNMVLITKIYKQLALTELGNQKD